MDFGSLLHVAQQNSKKIKNAEVKCYSTKFAPPKKETKEKKLSSNIQKFLAKKEEEEREKARIAKQKRDELMAMRDTKAKNKINKMLKVIKSANKSVLDDVDHDNTAVTMQGPDQPDEDDYGYVSQEASALYSKLMDKYKAMPEDKKEFLASKALSKEEMKSTKDRVRAAIIREQEEENSSHRHRQRHSKSDDSKSKSSTDLDSKKVAPVPYFVKSEEPVVQPKPKPKRPPPPAMDFQQLLKLAEQKQHEPITLETVKVKEPERLMTMKEKKEMEERRAFLEAKEKRQAKNGASDISDFKTPKAPGPNKMEPNGKIPKLNSGNSSKDLIKQNSRPGSNDRGMDSSKSSNKSAGTGTSKLYGALTKTNQKPVSSSSSLSAANAKSEYRPDHRNNIKSETSKNIASKPIEKHSSDSKNFVTKSKPGNITSKEFPPRDMKKPISDTKPKQLPPSESKPRQLPPTDVKPRQFQSTDLKSKKVNPSDSRPKQPQTDMRPNKMGIKRRILDDSDSEYDSEMDDFIDDGPDPSNDYSKYISEIFGYDKNRYRDEDYDDAQMESSFAQQMREEMISKKIGLMEDLEDMRQEALEKEKKSQMKKKKR